MGLPYRSGIAYEVLLRDGWSVRPGGDPALSPGRTDAGLSQRQANLLVFLDFNRYRSSSGVVDWLARGPMPLFLLSSGLNASISDEVVDDAG